MDKKISVAQFMRENLTLQHKQDWDQLVTKLQEEGCEWLPVLMHLAHAGLALDAVNQPAPDWATEVPQSDKFRKRSVFFALKFHLTSLLANIPDGMPAFQGDLTEEAKVAQETGGDHLETVRDLLLDCLGNLLRLLRGNLRQLGALKSNAYTALYRAGLAARETNKEKEGKENG